MSKSLSKNSSAREHVIFSLLAMGIGAPIFFFGVLGVVRSIASSNWPIVEGTILKSSVLSDSRGGRGSTTSADIFYEFEVDGTKYYGNRVAYGDYGSSGSEHAKNIVNRYPRGARVMVSYMPGNPEECLLEPGFRKQALMLPGAGLMFLLPGFFLIKDRKKGKNAKPRNRTDSKQKEVRTRGKRGFDSSSGNFLSNGLAVLILSVFSVGFLAGGSVCLVRAVSEIASAQASLGWPEAAGTILESSIRTNKGGYSVDLRYEYEVQGAILEGNRLTFTGVTTNRLNAVQRKYRGYPVGARVTVFYNPENPEESVLERGTRAIFFVFPLMGLVFSAIGLFMAAAVFFGLREKFSRKPGSGNSEENPVIHSEEIHVEEYLDNNNMKE